jgi:hypothetical protein
MRLYLLNLSDNAQVHIDVSEHTTVLDILKRVRQDTGRRFSTLMYKGRTLDLDACIPEDDDDETRIAFLLKEKKRSCSVM